MKSIIQILLICFFSFDISGQDYDLLGIVDDQLIKINSASKAIDVVGNLNPSPPEMVRFLTFAEEDCLIYGILDGSANPTLVSIDMELNFAVIGALTLPGSSLYFCEGLSFNNVDNTLYAAVSINGDIPSGDFYSETIVEVNRFTGGCQFKTEIIENVTFPDIDRMTFCDNILYFHDGQPGQWSKFFELDFSGVGVSVQGDELTSVSYIPTKDIECVNGLIYYSTGRDLSFFNPVGNNITNLGNLFTAGDFDGEEITGLGINPIPDHLNLEDNISICNETDYLLELDYPYSAVIWNNGSTGSSILVSESGLYWADVLYNNCTFRTDSININFELPLDISIGSDTVFCEGGSMLLTIDEPNIDVIWSEGTVGSLLEITEPGSYWAEYAKGGCTFYSDTINVTYSEPLEIIIGTHTTLCSGETLTISIDEPNISVIWSNGSVGNEIIISETGLYWAEYIIDGCTYSTDTIFVEVLEFEFELISEITLCEGDSHVVSIEGAGQNVSWSNGYIGNQLVITEPGLYWAVIMHEDCYYLTDTIAVIAIEPIEQNIVSDSIICVGETIYITINEPNIEVVWNDGSTGSELAIDTEGTYWGQYETEGCTFFTDTMNVVVVNDEYNIGADIVLCAGESYILDIEGVGQNVVWNNGQAGSQLEITEEGDYWAQIFLNNCQFATNAVNVSVIPPHTIDIGSDTVVCGGKEILLSILNPSVEYQWSTGEVSSFITTNENGSFWASSIGNECPSRSDTIEVRFIEDPTVSFAIDTFLCNEEVFDIPSNEFNINWKNEEDEQLTTIHQSGKYWGIYNIDQCTFATDTINLEFVDCTPCEYYVPNVISPNSDDVNDEFKVVFTKNCDIHEIEIFIFDRWGNLVGESKENYWDAEFNGTPVINGVYVYIIKMNLSSYNGDVQEITIFGDVTVLK